MQRAPWPSPAGAAPGLAPTAFPSQTCTGKPKNRGSATHTGKRLTLASRLVNRPFLPRIRNNAPPFSCFRSAALDPSDSNSLPCSPPLSHSSETLSFPSFSPTSWALRLPCGSSCRYFTHMPSTEGMGTPFCRCLLRNSQPALGGSIAHNGTCSGAVSVPPKSTVASPSDLVSCPSPALPREWSWTPAGWEGRPGVPMETSMLL